MIKNRLERLKKHIKGEAPEVLTAEALMSVITKRASSVRLRIPVDPVDWKKCIFLSKSERVDNVVTFMMSNKILQVSHLNSVIAICLADMNDLIAAGAKYHMKSLSAFFKSSAKAKKNFKDSDVCLCSELYFCASKRQINLIQFGTDVLISQMRLELSFHRAF